MLSDERIGIDDTLDISVDLTNTGEFNACEVVQLYVRDLVGNVTRPVKELKGFQRVQLQANESKTVTFKLHKHDLEFYDRNMQLRAEAGHFHIWVGGSSDAELKAEFELIIR